MVVLTSRCPSVFSNDELAEQLVVRGVRADPEPDKPVRCVDGEHAVMVTDAG